MNIKAVIKYELYDIKKAIVILYIIVYTLFIYFRLFTVTERWNLIYGMERATIIFMIVAGYNSFKNHYRFYQANGVLRGEQHIGFVIHIWVVAAGLALIDFINGLVFSKVVYYESIFNGLYHMHGLVGEVIWSMFVYALFFTVGYSISLLYYKKSRNWKVIVSLGVPLILFSLAVVDDWFNHATIGYWLINKVAIILGYANGYQNPLSAIIVIGLVTIIFTMINHAIIKRTALK